MLALIGEGLTNRQIGERLYLAEKTVKNHVSRLLAKLGVERRVQAALIATELRQSAAAERVPERRPTMRASSATARAADGCLLPADGCPPTVPPGAADGEKGLPAGPSALAPPRPRGDDRRYERRS